MSMDDIYFALVIGLLVMADTINNFVMGML